MCFRFFPGRLKAVVDVLKGELDMTTQPTIDQAKTEAFLGKVLSDTSGMTVTILASIGDRFGPGARISDQR